MSTPEVGHPRTVATRRWDLPALLANRHWVRRSRPFPHVVASNVFVPEFASALDDEFGRLLRDRPEAFVRNMTGYDASGADLDRHRDGPLDIFASRAWHDVIAGVAGVRATGDVSASLHHHAPGGTSGWPHNDLNPGWFGEFPPGEQVVGLPGDGTVGYHHGERPEGIGARETIRAVSVLFYLGNPQWRPGDGGETGLYRAPRPDGLEVAVAPVNNSLVLFECTPYSWHGFLANHTQPRNSLVMWLHRNRDDVVARWGAQRIVGW